MKKRPRDEQDRIDKLSDMFLYNIGYEHAQNTCKEADRLLGEYKSFEIPESLNEWFLKHQTKYNKKIKRENIRKMTIEISKRVAIIILVVGITSGVVTMSVEAFRIRFFNMVIETSQRFSSVTMEENFQVDYVSELPEEWSNYYYPAILPEGYKFFSAVEINDSKYMIFSDKTGNEIRFFQGNISSDLQLDSENGKIIEVEINGKKGIVFDKDDVSIVSWHNNEKILYIQGNVDKSILIEMAESVEKNK